MCNKEDIHEKFLCPCCQKTVFYTNEEFEICPVCLWQYEKKQLLDYNYCGGANQISLNEHKDFGIKNEDNF